MNDASLSEALKKLEVPLPDPSAHEKAWHRAQTAFANQVPVEPQGISRVHAWGRWAAALGGACLFAGMLGWAWMRGSTPSDDVFKGRTMMAEMEALFPGQLDGVITSGTQVSLDVATGVAHQPSPQRLALTLRQGRKVVRVLGYSGRKVCVLFAGRQRCLEPLVTGDGKVIVEGDDFLWNSLHPTKIHGYRVEARPLSL